MGKHYYSHQIGTTTCSFNFHIFICHSPILKVKVNWLSQSACTSHYSHTCHAVN